jgi:transcriptional regulator with XRE-family HTH domain
MSESDAFEGLGRALAELRKRAGFTMQKEAAKKLGIDQGQLSRWERDSPRPSLENLNRVLTGYGVTLMDLAVLVCGEPSEPSEPSEPAKPAKPETEDRGPTDEELIRALADAIRRVEGRQKVFEGRQKAVEGRVALIEEELEGEEELG